MGISVGKLGQLLVKKKLMSQKQVEEAAHLAASQGIALPEAILQRGFLDPEPLLEVLSEQYRMPYVRLQGNSVEPEAIAALPLKLAQHYRVMPLRLKDTTLTVAISNPQDLSVVDELRVALQARYAIDPVLATAAEIAKAIKQFYGLGAETISELVDDKQQRSVGLRLEAAEEGIEDIEKLADDASIAKLVSQLILEAHQRRATDIHIEPYRGKVRLRYRIDGVLKTVDVPPAIRQLFPAILSRIKVISGLNIVERRLPQDGRASVKVHDQKLDLRISILPTPFGESAVVRILPNRMLVTLEDLGFHEEDRKLLKQLLAKPHGLIFITGPTGSGKTTSLYAMINTLNSDDRKIITIEDPVEYEIDGVTQVQIQPGIGLSFAQGLRSMLRHDPDVMMVGEVRDLETAELAIRIALTGHLVLSTLHTNDAASGAARLLDMGVDPYLVTSAVECFIAQRLVRVLCAQCKVEIKPTRSGLQRMYEAKGCEKCQHTGFHGRIAIYELLGVTEAIKELILAKAPASSIWRKAIEEGMQTLQQDGWQKVSQGLTTVEEILRVTQQDEILRVTKEEA